MLCFERWGQCSRCTWYTSTHRIRDSSWMPRLTVRDPSASHALDEIEFAPMESADRLAIVTLDEARDLRHLLLTVALTGRPAGP